MINPCLERRPGTLAGVAMAGAEAVRGDGWRLWWTAEAISKRRAAQAGMGNTPDISPYYVLFIVLIILCFRRRPNAGRRPTERYSHPPPLAFAGTHARCTDAHCSPPFTTPSHWLLQATPLTSCLLLPSLERCRHVRRSFAACCRSPTPPPARSLDSPNYCTNTITSMSHRTPHNPPFTPWPAASHLNTSSRSSTHTVHRYK